MRKNIAAMQVEVILRRAVLAFCFSICVMGVAGPAAAQGPKYASIDVPQANGNGTLPIAVNLEGTVTGWYWDANGITHGFVRFADGKITPFDAPGAGTNPNYFGGTIPVGINNLGTVVGYENDENGVAHAFVRTADGKFKSFNAPGADLNPADRLGTTTSGINDLGTIAGTYYDTAGVGHGYVRQADGKFTSFEVVGAANGTTPDGPLNWAGALGGFYLDANLQFHLFVRDPFGKISAFDGPGMCTGGTPVGCYGGGMYDVNIFGNSIGAFMDNSGNFVSHQLLRKADGKITTWDAPGAGTGPYQGTGFNDTPTIGYPVGSLNTEGTVASMYMDSNSTHHGYVRTANGVFTTFDAPLADVTPGDQNGTWPTSINDFGVITGWYIDSSDVIHGFVRTPF
jgi:probable HAF family extracellular repeat protein